MLWMKFIFKYRYIIIIGILMATNSWTYNKYLSKRDELAVCTERYASRTAEVEACNLSVTNQNDSIDAWKLKANELEADIKKLSVEYGKISNKYNKIVYDILNEEVPKSCDGSMNWLVDKGKKK